MSGGMRLGTTQDRCQFWNYKRRFIRFLRHTRINFGTWGYDGAMELACLLVSLRDGLMDWTLVWNWVWLGMSGSSDW